MIGRSVTTQRIMTKKTYEQDRIRYFQQDNNREFISLLVCIYINEIVLLLILIY